MYDPFIEISKKIVELQMKDKEKEKAKKTYSLDGETILPVLKPGKAPINAVPNNSEKPKSDITTDANGNAILPTLSTEDKAGLKTELNKHTTVTTPIIPDATAPEGDKKDEVTTDTPSNEINLNDILANLQKGYAQSDEVKQALANWNKHMESRPTDWNGGNYLNPLNAVIGQINNRDPFKYDVNADALYHMYRDLYMQGGKMAMQDTMGQSAMMTGGYGNSYSATAGNQAYQGYLQQLNGVVPELYQLALNKYNAEGDALYDKASLYKSMYDQEYGEHIDDINLWYTEGERLGDMYSMLANDDYGKYVDEYNRALKGYQLSQSGGNAAQLDKTKTEVDISNVPNSVIAELEKITDNDTLDQYLAMLESQNLLTPDVAEALYEKYEIYPTVSTPEGGKTEYVPYMERTWERVSDGGANWGSIDEDAIIKNSATDDTMTLKELENAIIEELKNDTTNNYSSNKIRALAHNYVVELQKKLGISNAGAIWNVPGK